jgi:4-carboxymuconolactone decarboxylase
VSDETHETGMRVRREVLGDEYVDGAIANTTALTAAFQDFLTRCAWGTVWASDSLDRRTRSAITIAVLTALGREHELPAHLKAGVRNGLSHEEVAEVLRHTAVYAGMPAANSAFAIAQRALEDEDA